jgi:hypothetical protein
MELVEASANMVLGLLIFAAIATIFVAIGVSIWLGSWRSWIDSPTIMAAGGFAMPWFAISAIDAFVLNLVRVWVPLDRPIGDVMVGLPTAIGLVAAALRWPRWIVPPWYRQQAKEQTAQRFATVNRVQLINMETRVSNPHPSTGTKRRGKKR